MNATKLQHIQFLGNCVTELFRVDLPAAYQHAFVFIRQLAMILRDALTMKTKVILVLLVFQLGTCIVIHPWVFQISVELCGCSFYCYHSTFEIIVERLKELVYFV